MKVFLDCEFTRLRQDAQLISIGLVAEDGQEFYACFSDYKRILVSTWTHDHVLPNLAVADVAGPSITAFTPGVSRRLRAWLEALGPVEMWGDVPAYDWVLFCEVMGGALKIPENVSYIIRDIATMAELMGLDPDFNRAKMAGLCDAKAHNALWDARVVKACYEKMAAKLNSARKQKQVAE